MSARCEVGSQSDAPCMGNAIWRGSYDGWLSTNRCEEHPADVCNRPVDAAEQAYHAAAPEVRSPKLAYLVARRCLGVARDSPNLAVRADWIKAASMWRDLARDLRRIS